MVFPSLEFAFFFPVVLVLSWVLMPWPRVWKPFFLVASYVFYGAASAGWAVLLAAVTLANQLGAVLIARARTPRAQTWVISTAPSWLASVTAASRTAQPALAAP